MKIIGLTGSIAMGKSTTAKMFRQCGIAVSDSDAIVHALYRNEAVPVLTPHFPDAIVDGMVNRRLLAQDVLANPSRMHLLESIIHPLVDLKRREFIDCQRTRGANIAVVDIPLLFEIGGEDLVDLIVVVSASEKIQHDRAMAREGMTMEKFDAILSKQIPDAVKRRRAHFVIRTDYGLESAMAQVTAFLRAVC